PLRKRREIQPNKRSLTRVRERKAHRAASHHSLSGAAPQMRHPPKYAVLSPHQVSAHVMQSRRPPGAQAVAQRALDGRGRRKAGMHLDMIEQQRSIASRALEIQLVSLDGYRPRRAFGVQQEKEREQERNVA